MGSQTQLSALSADEGEEGKRALGQFCLPSEPVPTIVTTSRLLTTGVDVPTCRNVVIARRSVRWSTSSK